MNSFPGKVGDHYDSFEAAMMRLSDVIDDQIAAEACLAQQINNADGEKDTTAALHNAADVMDEQLEQLDKVAAWFINHNERLMSDYLDR
jgi:hypothetical protein